MEETAGPYAGRFRAIVLGDGSAGPIEVRLGRRLMRLVPADSAEGRRLLSEGRVDLIGPDGDRLGRISIEEARRRLRERLERLLESPGSGTSADGGRLGSS